jgi:glycosyltransferase involved in cell wall biosynthesis
MPFRIAVDACNLAADHRGMGRYVRHILRNLLQDSDLEITLVTRNAREKAAVFEDELLSPQNTAAVLTFREANRLHFNAVWYPWNGIRFDLAARKVVTIYDAFAFTEPHPQFIARWKEQRPIRRAIREADALATISHWSAKELARTFTIPIERFTIIQPVPDAFWQPPAMAEKGEKPYVLIVAGPDKRKNAKTLFQAFAQAFPQRNVTLTVAGKLSDEDETLLTRLPIAFNRVQPDDTHLRALYSNAIAVAVPSIAEGYGLPAVEAMACGAPVIAADAAALPEACDGAALLIPPLDIQAWNAALQSIVKDDVLRKRLREQSLLRVGRVSRTRLSDNMLELFDKPTGSKAFRMRTK